MIDVIDSWCDQIFFGLTGPVMGAFPFDLTAMTSHENFGSGQGAILKIADHALITKMAGALPKGVHQKRSACRSHTAPQFP